MSSTEPERVSSAAMTGLHRLLCSLFSGDGRDLRDFVRRGPEGELLASELLSGSVSLSSLVQSWIDRGTARGLLDADFFRRLMLTFPRRALEIHGIAQQWRADVDMPPTAPRRRWAPLLVPAATAVALGVAWAGAQFLDPALPTPLVLPGSEPALPCVPTGPAPYLPPPPRRPPVVAAGEPEKDLAPPPPPPRQASKGQLIILFRRGATESKPLADCWQKFTDSPWKLHNFEFHVKPDEALQRVVVRTADINVRGVVADCFERELAAILSRKRIRKLDPVTIKLAEIDPNQ